MKASARSARSGTSRIWCWLGVGFLWLVTCAATAQQGRPEAAVQQPGGYTINVSVEEVVLHATVQTRQGSPVSGLGKNDFQVFEDGVPQTIRHFSHGDIPVTAGLVIDNSGSMGPKRAEVIAAALAFAASSNPQDQMFLVNFNERVWFGLPADTPFSDRPEQLKTAMQSVKANGRTALYDAIAIALQHLKKGARDKRVLIVVTDGGDNASTHTRAEVVRMATESDALIYTLGIYDPDDPDRNPRLLRQLAEASGGTAFFPDSLREVVPILERIAREIRNQYTLSYTSTNQKQDGGYRSIQVRVPSAKGSSVTTRAGYVAPLKSAVAPRADGRD
jgi:Ca-activated chloride channel family protein